MDLHVHEPSGGHACYSCNLTSIGGLVSRDFRHGYGPEEYVLRRAYPGIYRVSAHYFGSHQKTLVGASTLLVNVFCNYGRENEEHWLVTVRLDRPQSTEIVCYLEV